MSQRCTKRKSSSVDDETDLFRQKGGSLNTVWQDSDKTSLTIESSHMTSTCLDLISRNNMTYEQKNNVLLDVKFIINGNIFATKYFNLCEV